MNRCTPVHDVLEVYRIQIYAYCPNSQSLCRLTHDLSHECATALHFIKSFGFKVYVCVGRSGLAWGVYTDGKTVGGFDVDGFGFVSVKTRHRPASGVGTGICVKDEMLASEITEDICREGLMLCPRWWKDSPRWWKDSVKNIVKYTPEEFFKEEHDKWNFNYEEQ